MRDRPFIAANETPRPFGDILAERRAYDPAQQQRRRALEDIAALEAQAQEQSDPEERKRLQCEAEGLRSALSEGAR